MDDNRLLLLLNKYQDGACTELEAQELEQWYNAVNTGNAIRQKIKVLSIDGNEELIFTAYHQATDLFSFPISETHGTK